MAVPTELRKQYKTTSLGLEDKPNVVMCSGTAFYISQQSNKIYLSNYDNKNSWVIYEGLIFGYASRQAVSSTFQFVDDKFWIFISTNNQILAYEIYPSTTNKPVILRSKYLNFGGEVEGVFTNNDIIGYTDVQVIANIKGTNKLRVNVYTDPFNEDGFLTYDLVDWTGKNGNDVSMIREEYGHYKTVSIAYTHS